MLKFMALYFICKFLSLKIQNSFEQFAFEIENFYVDMSC